MIPEWVIGCTISVFSSTILNVGVNFQRWSLVSEENSIQKGIRTEQRPYIKQPKWWLGFALFILGNLGDMTALSFASPTILVALGSISLVSNSFLGILFLKEPYSHALLFDNALIIFGAVLAILNGSHAEASYTSDDIKDMLLEPGFLILAFLYLSLIISLYMVSRVLVKEHRENKLSGTKRVFAPLVFGPILGVLASGTTIFGTSFSELTRSSMGDGESAFSQLIVYVVLLLLIICAITQVHMLSRALTICGSLAVVPVQYSCWVALSITASLVFFGGFDPKSLFLFILGVLITLFAVGLLSRHQYILQVKAKSVDAEKVDEECLAETKLGSTEEEEESEEVVVF